MSPGEITAALGALPPLESAEHHSAAMAVCTSLTEADLRPLEELVGDDGDRTRAFNALYVLLARHRRALDGSRFRETYLRHSGRFADVPMRALLESDLALLDPMGPDLSAALRHAAVALAAYPGNLALVAHHARVLAEYGWSGAEVAEADLRAALTQVERATEISPEQPRYRAVRAQLAALVGDFDTALASIQRAMDLEDSARSGYAVRVVEYHRIRADIVLRRETQAIRSGLRATADRLEAGMRTQVDQAMQEARAHEQQEIGRLRSETLGSLGLLAAVIAFIVTSTQVAQDMPLHQALRLLAGLAGMLTLVFTAFGAAFGVGKQSRLVLPALLGSALFALAWWPM
ncbi:tetratricopeptide repeat protein [Streptomyces sp. Da 82-17]|uniref:tetratricopeptide repeat protein n=1 Tax=Streptomyces sp. Da 82-17 TaxID=3377116 RepID=UPI0038D4A994